MIGRRTLACGDVSSVRICSGISFASGNGSPSERSYFSARVSISAGLLACYDPESAGNGCGIM